MNYRLLKDNSIKLLEESPDFSKMINGVSSKELELIIDYIERISHTRDVQIKVKESHTTGDETCQVSGIHLNTNISPDSLVRTLSDNQCRHIAEVVCEYIESLNKIVYIHAIGLTLEYRNHMNPYTPTYHVTVHICK